MAIKFREVPMNQLFTEKNLLKGFTLAIYVNIFSFILSVCIGVVWIYLLSDFWDWEQFLYLCLFYSANIIFSLLLKKWYLQHLQRRKSSQLN